MTTLSLFGIPRTTAPVIADKAAAGLPSLGVRIPDFDVWRQGYAGASVLVVVAGTPTVHASLFSDPGLTTPISNPQSLLTLTDENGATYGKWAQPVYAFQPYLLTINETNATGEVRPPITSLGGENASLAIAATARGGFPRTLEDALDSAIHAQDYGSLLESAGSVAVTEVLNRAIGAAAAQGAGTVFLPAGHIPYTTLTLPDGVVLEGQGEGATVLYSVESGVTLAIAGDGAGLRNLTLDGANLIPNSVGVEAIGQASPVFEHVLIKRFALGLRMKGGSGAVWTDFSISNCTVLADLRGDMDAASTGLGSTLEGITWRGGTCSLSTTTGILIECFDALAQTIGFDGIAFTGNVGDAVKLVGARGITFDDCLWSDNISNLAVSDGTNLTLVAINTSERIHINGGSMVGGTLSFNGACEDIAARSVTFSDISFVLNVPTVPILLVDCITDATTSATGDRSKLLRIATADDGTVTGVTTDANAITAWQQVLDPGDAILVEAKAVARRRDGTDYAIFWVAGGAARPGATLAYDTDTAAFTVGSILTGAVSGASARITAATLSGGAGSLTLRDITGIFIVGEAISDADGGAARAAGALAYSDAALDDGGSGDIRTKAPSTTSYAAAIDVSGAAVRVRVTGAASNIVEWTVKIAVLGT